MMRLLFFSGVLSLFFSGSYAQDLSQLMTELNQAKNEEEKIRLNKQIGFFYQKNKVYQKGIEYYQTALQLEKKNNRIDENTFKGLAYCQTQNKNFEQAIQTYKDLIQLQKDRQDEKATLQSLNQLVYLYKESAQYGEALYYLDDILSIHEANQDQAGIIATYNNMGYMNQYLGNRAQSLANYAKAISLGQQYAKNSKNLNEKATVLSNTGVTYSYLRDFGNAQKYFQEALQQYEYAGNQSGVAQSYNYLAANHYIHGKNEAAITQALKAINIAQPLNDEPTLLVSYQILADANQQIKELSESQKYYKLSQELKNKIEERERKSQQKNLEQQINVEKKENEIKSLLQEQERQSAALKQSELERQKQEQDLKIKENELILLKRNQDLQQVQLQNQLLDKERIQQMLMLTQQKAESDKQKQSIALLEKDKALQDLELQKKEALELERKNKIELLEKDKAIQDQQLEQEENLRYFGGALLLLFAIIITLVFIGFIQNRRKKKELQLKNNEILEKNNEILSVNEELQQNQEEIISQREFIQAKNRELEESHRQVKSSINAAMNIQTAILPYKDELDNLLHEYFILNQPKDVVSGDFYWIDIIGKKTLLVVADCTGHGVPGAFMTLIGTNLLDKIIKMMQITEPAEILLQLHKEVKIALKQEETGNNAGMDAVVLCMESMEDGKTQMIFAGAKNNIYFLIPENPVMQTLRGSRRSIGGLQNEETPFVNQEMIVPKGTCIYMGSDGMADQNNVKRKRLGDQKILDCLSQCHEKPMEAQCKRIKEMLQEHMEGAIQRDDILFVGFRV